MADRQRTRPGPDGQAVFSTVSVEFVQELLDSIRAISDDERFRAYLEASGLHGTSLHQGLRRVSHHQLVRLYQAAAVGSGDEMMGLWSRPIRAGALKHICRSLIDAPTVERALYRFCQFWNLLLDDYTLVLQTVPGGVCLTLQPIGPVDVGNRFGHALMLKLTHGIASWLAGHELACEEVAFAFPRPAFANDYPILFPATITFDAPCSSIRFGNDAVRRHGVRRPAEIRVFR